MAQQHADTKSLPVDVQLMLRRLPGNDRCTDCGEMYPEWASVSYGILVCLACAGAHRSLGVNVSFVKSLSMDSWSEKHIAMVQNGGNAKWEAVCVAAGLTLHPSPTKNRSTSSNDISMSWQAKYDSLLAHPYRKAIANIGQEFTSREFLMSLDKCIRCNATRKPNAEDGSTSCDCDAATLNRIPSAETASDGGSTPPGEDKPPGAPSALLSRMTLAFTENSARNNNNVTSSSDPMSVKCTLCDHFIPMEILDVHSSQCAAQHKDMSLLREEKEYEVTLGNSSDAALGLTFSKLPDGQAFVSKLEPNGDAERQNVVLGSVVVAMGDVRVTQFDILMKKAKTMTRPIKFRFKYTPDRVVTVAATAAAVSLPEPRMVQQEVVFEDHDVGFTVQTNQRGVCVVSSIQYGGAADQHGILVGSSVVTMNGSPVVSEATMNLAIESDRRPLMLVFHRVEGVMRGWR